MTKKDKWEWIKRTALVTVSILSIAGTGKVAIAYFAKAETVALIDMRLELAIEDDKVDRGERDYEWTKQQMSFEARKKPLTNTEKVILEKEKEKVNKLRKYRDIKQMAFEQRKK